MYIKLLGADGGGGRQASAWPDPPRRLTRTLTLTRARSLHSRFRVEGHGQRSRTCACEPGSASARRHWSVNQCRAGALRRRSALPRTLTRSRPDPLYDRYRSVSFLTRCSCPFSLLASTGSPTRTAHAPSSVGGVYATLTLDDVIQIRNAKDAGGAAARVQKAEEKADRDRKRAQRRVAKAAGGSKMGEKAVEPRFPSLRRLEHAVVASTTNCEAAMTSTPSTQAVRKDPSSANDVADSLLLFSRTQVKLAHCPFS